MFESPQWELGRGGEQVIRPWLIRYGYRVIVLANIADGGAPSLEGRTRIVLPDYQVVGGTGNRFVELKTKSEATLYKKTQTWEHGLELRLYHHYLAIAAETHLQVWLCILELRRNLVLLQDTAHLHRVRREYHGPNAPNGQPFVYFPCDEFDWYYGPSAIRLTPLEPQAQRTRDQSAPPEKQGPMQLDLWRT